MSNQKIAFITGAAGHIGGQTARALAKVGCSIVVADKNKERANTLANELNTEFGTNSKAFEIDLLDKTHFELAHNFVQAEYGKLDYLVNCAAFYDDTPGWGVPFLQEGYDAWEKVLKVNTMAPFFLAQKLHPLLLKSSAPSIVNVSSIYGIVGPDHKLYEGTAMTNPAAYAASKGGLQQVTTWLSTVLSPEIRVNTVTPGGVERGQNEVFVKRYKEKTPLNRMAKEEDIAEAISFLLSEKASYITGQNLVVDGGWTSW